MNLLFELSKEFTALPTDEILALFHAYDTTYTIRESNENVLIIDTDITHDQLERLAHRLALSFNVNELVFSCTNDTLQQQAKDHPIPHQGSIAISCKNRSEHLQSQPIIQTLAEIYTRNRDVDLHNPDVEIRAMITDTKIYVGIKHAQINRTAFEQRKVQFRPFFSPISLHPKLARTLVNLASIHKDEVLLDPFCGTGGILLEAGLCGIKVIGGDIEEKMIKGSQQTLDYYHISSYQLHCVDVGDIVDHIPNQVDAIVTDLPYGKSTTTRGEPPQQLTKRALQSFSQMIKNNGKAVVGSSQKEMITIGQQFFTLKTLYKLKVHRSMTRYFAVFQL